MRGALELPYPVACLLLSTLPFRLPGAFRALLSWVVSAYQRLGGTAFWLHPGGWLTLPLAFVVYDASKRLERHPRWGHLAQALLSVGAHRLICSRCAALPPLSRQLC